MACRRTTCDCAFAHADVSGRLDCQAVQSKVQIKMVRGKKWDAAGKAADPAPVILVILLLHLVILLLLLVILAPAVPTAPAAPAPSRSGLIGVARLAKKN